MRMVSKTLIGAFLGWFRRASPGRLPGWTSFGTARIFGWPAPARYQGPPSDPATIGHGR